MAWSDPKAFGSHPVMKVKGPGQGKQGSLLQQRATGNEYLFFERAENKIKHVF